MRLRHLVEVDSQGRNIHLLIRLEAEAEPEKGRRPVNLALVIDRSSSMRGPRILQAVRAATELVEKLDSGDRLTVITFDANARTVFGPDAVTDETKPRLYEALAGITTGVGTNLGAGIKRGADAIKSGFVRSAISRLILLTDGQPSLGLTDRDRLSALVESEAEAGVHTTAMGIGEGFEDELLAELARRGQGGFHYLAQAADIPAAFGRELEGVFAIAATEAVVKLVPHADVFSVDLLHRMVSRPLGDGLAVELGEVADGAPRSVLFRLGRDPEPDSRHLGTLTLSYRDASGKPADPRIIGIDLPDPDGDADREEARAVALERVRLEVASSVDVAWARRASGDSVHALAALVGVKRKVEQERDSGRLPASEVPALLDDIATAEEAVAKSAAERERIRRDMKAQSQITLLGRSSVRPLPPEDD